MLQSSWLIAQAVCLESIPRPRIGRVPEPKLVMDSASGVAAFDAAGAIDGPSASLYLAIAAAAGPVIAGSRSVVDLGCGSGRLLLHLARLNPVARFTGVDLSEPMLSRGQVNAGQSHLDNVTFTNGDITDLKGFADDSVDAVISSLACHHLPDPASLDRAFSEMRRILKPDGKLFVFDLVRPKFQHTVDVYAALTRASDAELLRDVKNSMRASFSPQEVERSVEKHFGRSVQMVATRVFPLYWWVQSPPAQNWRDTVAVDYLTQTEKDMSRHNRANYAALQLLFRLSRIKPGFRS